MDTSFDNLIVEGPVVGVVPEPGSFLLVLSGLGGLVLSVGMRRRTTG
jgi:hypothetical protein